MKSDPEQLMHPLDEHNQKLLAHVHPADYQNPAPEGRYNLVVIGGGTAGLVSAAGAAGLGAKVALVERHLLGGDCLNTGCVPSKALLRSARAAAEIRDSERYGIRHSGEYEVDFPAVMERMRKLRAQIAPADSAATLTKKGVDVFLGEAKFVDSETVQVDNTQLKFARAVIATGARAALPPIPGIDRIDALTNETLFTLTELPTRLAIIGAGPIGAEMAQAFARFGSKVTLYDTAPEFLPRDDREAAAIVQQSLARDGVQFRLGISGMEISRQGTGARISVSENGQVVGDEFDRVLVAAGRRPNVEGLELERVGVKYSAQGIKVNDRLRTTNARIYACGDVASAYKFTHAADALARIVIGNTLFFGMHRASGLIIPWATYTDPEIAHVGVYGNEETSKHVETITMPLAESDRAVLDGQNEGLLKIHHDGKGLILGATIVAAHAGELISEIVFAMNHRIRLGALASVIHPYPTQSEIIKRAGDAFRRELLTPQISKIIKRILDWRR